jgi:hypothetical protein
MPDHAPAPEPRPRGAPLHHAAHAVLGHIILALLTPAPTLAVLAAITGTPTFGLIGGTVARRVLEVVPLLLIAWSLLEPEAGEPAGSGETERDTGA